MTEPIRVLIADDHPLFRDGLTALLTDGPDTELAGAASSGTEAVELARDTSPGSEGHPPAASPFRRPVSRLFPGVVMTCAS